MAETRVLIVVNDVEAGEAYRLAFLEIGAACDVAPSFTKMADMAIESPYNGLVIDILTLVRCSKEEKAIAYECINLFPVLRVKWDKKRKQINLSPLEQTFSPDAASVLRFFIESRCSAFPSRSLRRDKRKQLTLNVLLSTEEAFPEAGTARSFTLSVSIGGAFVHTMDTFLEGERLWLRFLELADPTPIPVTVRWSLEWGVSRSIPGIGVKFETLTERQRKELERISS